MTEIETATVSVKEEQKDNGTHQEEEETELDSKIIRQVEYYFGDANLPRDKFLREQVKLDDGWVPLDILIKFNRLAKLTTDLQVIANAVNKSKSGLVEISDDSKKVRRSPEMPLPEMNEERRKDLQGRTVYTKGFPKDSVLDDILKFFKDHGEVENVIMRRYLEPQTKTRKFKGSVFATFKDKELAEKFIATKDLKFGETELICLWQVDYLQHKQEEYVARKEKKEKKQKEGEVKQEAKDEIKLPTGTVLFFSEGHDKMTREDVKEALTPLGGEIAYIDFKVGDTQGWVRLTKQDAAKEVIAKITEAKIKIGDAEVKFKLLEGDEEKEYLDRTVEEMSKRRRNMKNNKHQNRGNKNKGRQQFNRKRKQGKHDEAPESKVKAE